MDAPTLTLGGIGATLGRCSPLSAAALARTQEQAEAGGSGLILALGASALVECWPMDVAWPYQPRPRKWRPGERIEQAGHDVFDRLADLDGIKATCEACSKAYAWSLSSLMSKEEMDAARDFSEAPSGA